MLVLVVYYFAYKNTSQERNCARFLNTNVAFRELMQYQMTIEQFQLELCANVKQKSLRYIDRYLSFNVQSTAGKKRAAIVRRYPALFLCLCFHTTYSFTTDGYGIFNVRINVDFCRKYTRMGVRHKHACTRVDRKTCLSPSPARGSNIGSSD